MNILLRNIFVGERQRVDLGDIESLAASISEHGLIEPIVVDENLRLIAGRRRMEACISLGWAEIPAVTRTNLNEYQKQALELEEDLRRKDRTWYEKCFAVEKLYRLKRAEHGAVGEDYSLRMMEEQTCFSRARLGDMLQLCRVMQGNLELAKTYDSMTEAFKNLVLVPKEQEIQAELERRAGRASMSAVQSQDSTEGEDSILDDGEEPTPNKSKASPAVIQLNAFNRALGPKDHGKFSIILAYDTDTPYKDVLPYLSDQGVYINWTRSRFEPHFDEATKAGFNVIPWPIIWQWQVGNPVTHWPFSPNYANGIIAIKNHQPSPRPHPTPTSSVITCLANDYSILPFLVVHICLTAVALPETPVLLWSNIDPMDVVASSANFIPIIYEPDAEKFKTKQQRLVESYQAKYPNAEIRL